MGSSTWTAPNCCNCRSITWNIWDGGFSECVHTAGRMSREGSSKAGASLGSRSLAFRMPHAIARPNNAPGTSRNQVRHQGAGSSGGPPTGTSVSPAVGRSACQVTGVPGSSDSYEPVTTAPLSLIEHDAIDVAQRTAVGAAGNRTVTRARSIGIAQPPPMTSQYHCA